METKTRGNGIRVETQKGPITVDSISAGNFAKPGMEQAQLRQVVESTSFYPSARIANSLSDNLFAPTDFTSLSEQSWNSKEVRVTWMPVPEGTTVEEVEAKIKATPLATIYRILSNQPVLTEEQKQAIKQELKTLDDFAVSQVVRYPEGAKNKANEDVSGQLILDPNGNIQYKVNHFSIDGKKDIDLRSPDAEVYIPEALVEELEGAMSVALNQTV